MSKLSVTPFLLTALLAACGGDKAAPAPPETAPVTTAVAGGEDAFAPCMTCHQATGLGVPGTYPPLAGSEMLQGPAEVPIAIVLHGFIGPITRQGNAFDGAMVSWAALDDEQIAKALTYARSSWGNTAPAVTAAEVAAVRAATAARTTQWTEAELKTAKLKP